MPRRFAVEDFDDDAHLQAGFAQQAHSAFGYVFDCAAAFRFGAAVGCAVGGFAWDGALG